MKNRNLSKKDNRLILIRIMFLFSLLFSGTGLANNLTLTQPRVFPDKVQSLVNTMREVGTATLSIFFFDIYQSRLLTPSGNYPVNEQDEMSAIIFEIHYLRDIDSHDLVKQTIKQWEHLKIDKIQYSNYVDQLSTLWPNIKKGDTLHLYVSGYGSAFYFNGHYLGQIDDENFGELFLDIWLSLQTSQPKLRQKLLNLDE